MDVKLKCSDCGRELPDDSQFCQYCGSKNITKVEPEKTNTVFKRCIDCGKELPEDSDFCQYCGSKRVAIVNNQKKEEKKDKQKNNNQSGNFKIPFIIATIVAILAICGVAYLANTNNENIEMINTLANKLDKKEAELKTEQRNANSFRTKASYYDDVVNYASYSRSFTNFYAKKTLMVRPTNETVWIYFGYNGYLSCQSSSSNVHTSWGDWSGNWARLNVTYSGSSPEYIKITNSINSEYFYITVVGY